MNTILTFSLKKRSHKGDNLYKFDTIWVNVNLWRLQYPDFKWMLEAIIDTFMLEFICGMAEACEVFERDKFCKNCKCRKILNKINKYNKQ